jgi:hypothetical protein
VTLIGVGFSVFFEFDSEVGLIQIDGYFLVVIWDVWVLDGGGYDCEIVDVGYLYSSTLDS